MNKTTTPQKWVFNFLPCPDEKDFGVSFICEMIAQWDKYKIEWFTGLPMGNAIYTSDELKTLGYIGFYTQE